MHSPTAEGLLDGSPARLETMGFGVSARCGGTWEDAPVIQQLRDMADAAGLFRRAKPEIMVLGSLKAGPHPPDFVVE